MKTFKTLTTPLVAILVLALSICLALPVSALGQPQVTLSSDMAGAEADYTITFTTGVAGYGGGNEWIVIQFPEGTLIDVSPTCTVTINTFLDDSAVIEKTADREITVWPGYIDSETPFEITFTDCITNPITAGNKTLSVCTLLEPAVQSNSYTIVPGPVHHLSLSAPADINAGTRAAYTVTRYDQYDNPVTDGNLNVYLSSSSDGANKKFFNAAVDGDEITQVTIPHGASTANFWYYDDKAGGWTITASDAQPADGAIGLGDATDVLTVNPAAASKIRYITKPGSATAGQSSIWSVQRQDQYNNTVTAGDMLVTLASNSTGDNAEFRATSNGPALVPAQITISAGSGSEAFYYYDEKAGDWEITASAESMASVSHEFTVNPAEAAKLDYTAAPDDTTAGSETTAFTVQRQDAFGNPVASGVLVISLASSSDSDAREFRATSGGESVETVTIADTASAVNFYYYDEKAGACDITASSGLLTDAVHTLTVNSAAADNLSVTTQGNGTETAGTAFSVTLTVRDQFDNICDFDTDAVVINFTSNATQAPDGTTDPIIPSPQNVDFENGSGTAAGFKLVNASESPTITAAGADGSPLNNITVESDIITVNPGSAVDFAITGDKNEITAGEYVLLTITALDSFGNLDTAYTGDKTLTFTGPNEAWWPHTITMPTVSTKASHHVYLDDGAVIAFTEGVAVGSYGVGVGGALTLFKSEVANIAAADDTNGVTTPGGNEFAVTVNPRTASMFYITPWTDSMAAGTEKTLTIHATDQWGNHDSDYDGQKTLTFTGLGTALTGEKAIVNGVELGGDTAADFVGGQADVTLVAYLAETASLDVSDGTIDSSETIFLDCDLIVSPGPIDSLSITQQPSATTAGEVITPAITVTAQDTYGNAVSGQNITASLSAGTGVLEGAATKQTVSGLATFDDLSIKTAGSGKKLLFTHAATSKTVESEAFIIAAGPVDSLTITQQPEAGSDHVAGVAFSPAYRLLAKDSLDNPVEGVQVMVSLQNGFGTLGGTLTVTTGADGIAESDDLWIDLVGAKTLRFSGGGKTVDSNSIDVIHGELHTFSFSAIGGQDAGVEFNITITAEDVYGNTVADFTEKAALSDTSGTIDPGETGNFNNGVWTGNVSVSKYGGQENNVITAASGDVTGNSGQFNVADYPIRNTTQGLGYTAAQGIQAAVDDADPGDIIEVDAGTYNENLFIEKDLTLRAPAGPTVTKLLPDHEAVVTVASGHTVTIDGFDIDVILTDGILIDGSITAGTAVTVQNCVIRQNERHGIYVAGDIAGTLVVDNNIIAQNGQNGICIGGIVTGEVTITDNTIGEIDDGAWDLNGNSGNGIYIETVNGADAEVTITGNTIDGNGSDGILISEVNVAPDTITIADNISISNNGGSGIYLDTINQSTLIIEHNTLISGNENHGIFISTINDASTVTIRGTLEDGASTQQITGNGNTNSDDYAGIKIGLVSDDSTLTIEGNDVSGNVSYGIRINGINTSIFSVYITGNLIRDNNAGGLWVGDIESSRLIIQDNQITGSGFDGIFIGFISDESIVEITGTVTDGVSTQQINNNGTSADYYDYAGIYVDRVSNDSTLTISGSEISMNKGFGIMIEEIGTSPETVTISGNILTGNEATGLYVDQVYDSRLIIKDNLVTDSGFDGIFIGFISDESIVEITGTVTDGVSTQQITGSGTTDDPYLGIYVFYVSDDSTLTIEGNDVSSNTAQGIRIDGINASLKSVYITGNLLRDNGAEGVRVNVIEASRLVIEDNEIAGNGYHGICIGAIVDASTVDITGTITDEKSTQQINGNGNTNSDDYAGINIGQVSDDSTLTISGSEISENSGQGIYIDNVAGAFRTVNIGGNLITKNLAEGIYVSEVYDSTLNITGNTISENTFSGIIIEGVIRSDVTVEDNQVHDNESIGIGFGIISDEVDTVIIRGNTVTGHIEGGKGDFGHGIAIGPLIGSSLHITYNTLENNTNGLIFWDLIDLTMAGELTVTNNNFVGNLDFGLFNMPDEEPLTEYDIDARNNWWGSATGPTHEDNEGGTGDAVSDHVLYDPWRTSAAVWPIPTPPASGHKSRSKPAPAVIIVEKEGFADTEDVIMVNKQGVTLAAVMLTTPDQKSTLTIASGTEMKDGESKIPSAITVTPIDETDAPPPPPAASVALMYDFGPDGAAFNPPLSISIPLPEGDNPDGAVIAYWDGAAWLSLPTTYDPITGMLTAQISHFTTFAVIVPDEEPAVTPTPVQTPAAASPTPAAQPVPETPAVTPTASSPAASEETGGLSWWAILFIIIAALVMLGFIGWHYKKRRNNS